MGSMLSVAHRQGASRVRGKVARRTRRLLTTASWK